MFDPETKQVIYNPEGRSQMSGGNKDLVVTIAQDVKTEASSRESKSESFGLNLGFEGTGLGINYQKVKIREQKQESHHQVNIAINVPGDCNEGCKVQADKAFELANNALHGDSHQKRVNWTPNREGKDGTLSNPAEKNITEIHNDFAVLACKLGKQGAHSDRFNYKRKSLSVSQSKQWN